MDAVNARLRLVAEVLFAALIIAVGALCIAAPLVLAKAAGLGLILFAFAVLAQERALCRCEREEREKAHREFARDHACATFGLPFAEIDDPEIRAVARGLMKTPYQEDV